MGYIDPKLVEGAAALVESFTCAICFNLFEKPRTACSKGHTFCAECLTAARARAPNNCPTCREDSSVDCFGKFAPIDKDAKTLTFHLQSRTSPLRFKQKQLSHSLSLGSFDQVFGQARFLHGDGNYYFKGRLYFSSPFREQNLNGDPATCTIYVKKLTGQKVVLKARPDELCLSLKQKIRDSTNIPLERQRLIIRGRQLVDGKRLYESNVFDGTTVHLVLRPPPGGWCSIWWGE